MNKVIVKHIYQAKQETLFKFWTTPEFMQKFFDADCKEQRNVVVKNVNVDLRVGGKHTVLMGGKGHPHSGEYKEIIPYSKIVFTWSSPVVKDTLVTVEFKAIGDKTECTLTHELLPSEWIEAHTGGWNQIFKHLEKAIV